MGKLKQIILENLKTEGYHEHQLNELNPIIDATIEATKQALNIPVVRQSFCPRCNHENEAHVVNNTVYWDCPNCGITGQTDL